MRIFKTPWQTALMAAMLCAATVTAQPLVTVPTSCEVVVPGVGGVTGFGGKVGDGGIVTMPEPSGMGNVFSFAGATPISWRLLGDLSLVDHILPPDPPLASAGAVTAVEIMSYNKNLRTAEEHTPSTNARSKGRVTIEYTQDHCNNKMSFDIYKVWGDLATINYGTRYAPPIVGPNCWGTGLITFSVDQVSSDNALDAIGFDQYYWDIWNGHGENLITAYPNLAYTSADASSITVIQDGVDWPHWLDGGPYKMRVCYGRANPWDGGINPNLHRAVPGFTCVAKEVGEPLVPAYAGGFPTCVEALSPILPIAIASSNYNPAYTYTWSRSNLSWSFTPNSSGGLSITGIGDGNPCTFFLNLSGPCGSSAYSYTVNRTYTMGLVDPGPLCVSTGSNALTINTPDYAQGNQTCWGAIPSGWTWTAVGSSGRTFTIPAGAAGSTNTISIFNCSCPGTTNITVNVRPATPGPISGPICITLGAPETYSVPQSGTFTWTLPVNWTGSSTTNTINVTPLVNASTLSVVLNGQAGCPSLVASEVVHRYPVITQPICLNSGSPTTGAVFTSTEAGTTWSFPSGLTASTPPAGGTATINVIGTPGTYPCTATANGCLTHFDVVVPAIPPAYVTLVDETVIPGSSLVYTTFVSGNQYRLWDCTANAPASGAFGTWQGGSSSYQLSGSSSGSYAIEVDPSPAGGCTFRSPCVTTVHNQMPVVGGGQATYGTLKSGTQDGGILVVPNPNDGQFTVHVFHDFKEGLLLLYDAKGTRVGNTTRLVPGTNPVHEDQLAPGVYQLRLEIDGKVENRSIVVNAH